MYKEAKIGLNMNSWWTDMFIVLVIKNSEMWLQLAFAKILKLYYIN